MRAHCSMRALVLSAASLIAVLLAVPAQAPAQGQSPPKQNAQQQAAAPGPAMPDSYKMNMLIRTTLLALSQANATGNYTVLRDLGSPEFLAGNSAARLTEAFSDLRRRKLDFSPILFFDPKLVRQPSLDEAGRLRLRGFIETRPEQINFDMLFQNVQGDWRLFGLAVEMQPMPAASAASPPQPAPSQKPVAAASKNRRVTETSTPPKK